MVDVLEKPRRTTRDIQNNSPHTGLPGAPPINEYGVPVSGEDVSQYQHLGAEGVGGSTSPINVARSGDLGVQKTWQDQLARERNTGGVTLEDGTDAYGDTGGGVSVYPGIRPDSYPPALQQSDSTQFGGVGDDLAAVQAQRHFKNKRVIKGISTTLNVTTRAGADLVKKTLWGMITAGGLLTVGVSTVVGLIGMHVFAVASFLDSKGRIRMTGLDWLGLAVIDALIGLIILVIVVLIYFITNPGEILNLL